MSEQIPALDLASLDLASMVELFEDLSSFEQFLRINKLYTQYVQTANEGPLSAEERRTLRKLVRISILLIEPADILLQRCQELTHQMNGPELQQQLTEMIASERFSDTVRERLSDKDLLQLAKEGAQRSRTFLAAEHERLQGDLGQIDDGQRPSRDGALDEVSDDALLGAGATLLVGGVAVAVAVVLAPKKVGKALGAGAAILAIGGTAVASAGAAMIVMALVD